MGDAYTSHTTGNELEMHFLFTGITEPISSRNIFSDLCLWITNPANAGLYCYVCIYICISVCVYIYIYAQTGKNPL